MHRLGQYGALQTHFLRDLGQERVLQSMGVAVQKQIMNDLGCISDLIQKDEGKRK